jgi:glyoxylase-like metal-dependent hydrolase (beta-lactamase superfamily II)/rhodanese-related sulfurtransferase
MIFQQFRHEQGSCLSYILGCTKARVCAVVDSQYDIRPYLAYARERGMKITHIFETHTQADHLSGAKQLHEQTGAEVHIHEASKAAFPVRRIKDGDEFMVGNIRVKIAHTPGHTADSVSYVVSDTVRSQDPWFILTGDTLFVGDTGRPDLDGDAGALYDSIWKKIIPLGDAVEIYPAHYAGSSCGKAMSPKPSSTIGFEKKFNAALSIKSREEFVKFANADLPVQPPRFQQVRKFNLGFLDTPPIGKTYDLGSLQIDPRELKARMDAGEKLALLDVREPHERKTANIGGKHIPLGEVPDRLEELERDEEIVVYCHHGGRSMRAVEFLYESGFTNVKNLTGGIDAWSVNVDRSVARY